MIPTIGLMIGCYIVTRMISFITRTGEHKESSLTKIVAVLTLVVTLLFMGDLFLSGVTTSSRTSTLQDMLH